MLKMEEMQTIGDDYLETIKLVQLCFVVEFGLIFIAFIIKPLLWTFFLAKRLQSINSLVIILLLYLL